MEPSMIAMRTDRGLVRERNEDAVIAARLTDGAVLLAVADGIGGVPGGQEASRLAIGALEEVVTATPNADTATLLAAFEAADRRVREEQSGSLSAMGSTLVAALIRGDTAWLVHIGDSRAYLYEPSPHELGDLRQLTEDHSLAAERIRAEEIAPDSFEAATTSHILTRSIGGGAERARPDALAPLTLPRTCVLLLCSDGLYGPVSDEEILVTIDATPRDPGALAQHLIELAHKHDAPDNVSVGLLVRG
jgi:protein phosphatase